MVPLVAWNRLVFLAADGIPFVVQMRGHMQTCMLTYAHIGMYVIYIYIYLLSHSSTLYIYIYIETYVYTNICTPFTIN